MKVTKNQLRSIVRDAVRHKLELGPDDMVLEHGAPLDIDGPVVTMEQLQRVIDEEYELALALREDLFDYTGKGSQKRVNGRSPGLVKVGNAVGMLRATVERLEDAVRDNDEEAVHRYLQHALRFIKGAEAALYGQN